MGIKIIYTHTQNEKGRQKQERLQKRKIQDKIERTDTGRKRERYTESKIDRWKAKLCVEWWLKHHPFIFRGCLSISSRIATVNHGGVNY